jgi:hypothetical protein
MVAKAGVFCNPLADVFPENDRVMHMFFRREYSIIKLVNELNPTSGDAMSAAALRFWDDEWPEDGSKPEDMESSVRRAVQNFKLKTKPQRLCFGRRYPQGMVRRCMHLLRHEE